MWFFLQLVAAAFTALLLLILIVILVVRWKLRRFFKNIGEAFGGLKGLMGMGLPPLELKLEPQKSVEWDDEVAVHAATAELTEQGFKVVGNYLVESNDLSLRALHHPERHLDAVLYEAFGQGVWCDVVASFQDGTYLTYTSSKAPRLDNPPGKEKQVFPEATPTELVQRLRAEMPDKPLVPTTAETFVDRMVSYYNDEMQWRIARGGVTEEEVIRCAEDGETPDADTVAQVRTMWQMHIANHFDEKLRENFLAQCTLPISEFEEIRNRLVFVHEYSSPDGLAELTVVYDEDDDIDIDEDDDGDGEMDRYDLARRERQEQIASLAADIGVRQAFRRMLESSEISNRYRYLQEMQHPMPADVYVGPDLDD